MVSKIHFRCPGCGKKWQASFENAGRLGTCRHCDQLARVPALVARQPNPARDKVRMVTLCAALCLAEVLGFAVFIWRLEEGRHVRKVELANLAVAHQVDTARRSLQFQDWDGALTQLEAAVATEAATDLGEAEALLGRARQGKAAALVEAERRMREDLLRREEAKRQEREARVRATPLFQELRDRVAQTWARLNEPAPENPVLFAYLFRELKVTDPKEQDRLRREANRRPEEKGGLEQSVAKMRTGIKERFRSLQQFDEEDRAAFDRAVDQELNRLTEALKESGKEEG